MKINGNIVSCAGNFALRARCKWRGCRVEPLQKQRRIFAQQNTVVSGTRMYRERPLLGFTNKSRGENGQAVFLLSVRRLSYLMLSDVIKGIKADCNSL
ncbi:hypothetical protein IZU27_03175 [Treponema socranskii]|uniref:hypothetical protein n=1 Tax=Treponema socranskii TaxID=53419 RepID=UPI003D8BBE32